MKLTQKIALLFIFLCFQFSSTSISGQNLDTDYNNYFSLEREIPYLHLNKTAFIVGEEIWFKSYVQNFNTKKLNINTNNLFVSVYDSDGELKERKLVFIDKGIGAGNFKIDSTYTKDEYFIKAHTNWMRNFSEDESFLQKINIIQNKKKKEQKLSNDYDIQFLPESGHLLVGVENTVGVVIKDKNNNGIQIKKSEIVDEENNVVALFKTNLLGLGSFDIIYQANKSYTAKIYLFDGNEIEKKILSAENKGVILSVYNPNTTFISVFIKTNKATLSDLQNKKYTLYIHNAHTTLKRPFSFSNEATEYNIILNTRKLDAGVNIITLFNENNKPVAERLFFNYNKSLFASPKISYNKVTYDSLSIKINKKKTSKESYFLSASLLPEDTKSYQPSSNIISKFLLAPYIKGNIESPEFYFKNTNRKKLMELDLLFLTQGWSKFKWDNIFNSPPKENFVFEKGITLKGNVNSNKDFDTAYLMSPENNLMISAPIENKKFEFNLLNISEKTKVNVSLKKGNNIKKGNVYLQYFPAITKDKLTIPKKLPNFNTLMPQIDFSDFMQEGVKLDEIVIKGKEKKKERKLAILGAAKSYKIDEPGQKNLRIFTFIRNQGFLVNENNGSYSIYSGRPAISFQNTRPTQVYFNDNLIQDENGFNSLQEIDLLTLKDFEEVIISKTGFGKIYLYANTNIYYNSVNRFSEDTVPFGYVAEKEYYQPYYASYTDNLYKHYGVIDWKPNVEINENSQNTSFNSPLLGQKNMKLFLEGITSDGKLIFEEKIITIE